MSKIIKGKKVTTRADAIAGDMKALGRSGAALQKEGLKSLGTAESAATSQIARQSKLAAQGAKDQAMRARQGAAQRGLKGTSIGMGMEQQAANQAAQKIQNIRGQKTGLKRAFAQENMGIGSNLIAQRGPITMNTTTRREGGMGKMLGSLAGQALIPGPMGAQIGGALGGMAQGS